MKKNDLVDTVKGFNSWTDVENVMCLKKITTPQTDAEKTKESEIVDDIADDDYDESEEDDSDIDDSETEVKFLCLIYRVFERQKRLERGLFVNICNQEVKAELRLRTDIVR